LANVLVVGSGGREHALGWRLKQSSKVDTVFTAPGNGGTENNVDISVDDLDGLADFAEENECFTVVGPEAPLARGIVDMFRERGLPVFGPGKDGAQLESSKVWAKEFMKRNGIPTADFEVFDDPKRAKQYVDSLSCNVVVKADGLAAGKGVIVCSDKKEAHGAIDAVLADGAFGDAGDKIVIEERIDGIEASYIALCDGRTAVPMASSQDHKRAFDGDRGPNTGGMGAYSPTPVVDGALAGSIQNEVIDKTVESMKKEGIPFTGFLYAGIMIKDSKPYVLEFNVRMGDPECQPIMMRADFDLYDYLLAGSEGKLDSMPRLNWTEQSSACVVLASVGYPGPCPKNEPIRGIEDVSGNAVVFHAGTKRRDGAVLTDGGRVLGVTALGDSLRDAIDNAYSAAEKISWGSKFCRRDIGKKGLACL